MRIPAAFKFMHGDKYFKIIPHPPVLATAFAPFSRSEAGREEDDSLPRDSHDDNADLTEKTTERRKKERKKEREQ